MSLRGDPPPAYHDQEWSLIRRGVLGDTRKTLDREARVNPACLDRMRTPLTPNPLSRFAVKGGFL
jgi:hypothetical protein